MIVRPARLDDLPTIVAIDAVGRPAARPTALFAAALDRLLVLEAEGVRAFAEVHTLLDEAELIDIAVAPADRRRGLGRTLLRAVIERASTAGATVVLLEVREGNHSARNLYESEGFQVTGRRRRYYADGEDAVLYARPLGADTADPPPA